METTSYLQAAGMEAKEEAGGGPGRPPGSLAHVLGEIRSDVSRTLWADCILLE